MASNDAFGKEVGSWAGRGGLVSRRASVNWIMLIYFASGACSLIDEVVWVRLLKLTLGNTVYASSIVVSVFMGGLALGALIMGRYCDRVKYHLRLYALLESLVTISALALPLALRYADNIYVLFYRRYQPSPGVLLLLQVMISAMILLVPSMLMGSTLPLLGRFVTALEREAGHLVGRLYALNTLGAAVGCFLAGFVLIRSFGVMGTLYSAALLNLLVAFGGWFLSMVSGIESSEETEPKEAKRVEVVPDKYGAGRFYLLITAFFMSGLISISYELLWMRSVIHLIGGTTYVFSAVLTVYLLGNVVGAGLGSRLTKRLKKPEKGFAVTLLLLGLCGVLYLPALVFWTSRALPYSNEIFEAFYQRMSISPYLVKPIVHSMFLFFIPAVIMGVGFPIALQAWANHVHKVGRSTGTAYGANTIGAVIGGVVTGFVLIPFAGLQISIMILGLTGVWIAGVMWLLFAGGSRVVGHRAFLGIAVLLTIFSIAMPSSLFNIVIRMNPALPPDFELVAVKEGVTSTISLHRDQNNALRLYSAGQSLAGDAHFLRGDQKMLGHFGVLLNSSAKKVLSVGFGSGESTQCLVQHKIEQVDCVEIAPEVVEISLKYFRHINLGDKLDKEVNMIFMDAKNYLHLTDNTYDAIINDSIDPRHFADNASLYTKEYFESARGRLNENGLFLSWIPVHEKDPTSLMDSIIGTMMEVFPYVTIWHMVPNPAAYLLVVGSQQPQHYSVRHMENEMLKPGVRESLKETDINNSMDVLSCYLGDKNDLKRWVSDFSINSDYRPFVEFNTEYLTSKLGIFPEFITVVRRQSVYDHIDWSGFSEEDKKNWLSDYEQVYQVSTCLLKSYGCPNELDKLRYRMDGLSILPNNPALLYWRSQSERELLAAGVKMVLSGDTAKALLLANNILDIYPESAIAWMIKSQAMQHIGNMQRALSSARRAAALGADNYNVRFNLGFILFSAGRFAEAAAEYKETLRLAELSGELTRYTRIKMLDSLASAYAKANRFGEAVTATKEALELAVSIQEEALAERLEKRLLSFESKLSVRQR